MSGSATASSKPISLGLRAALLPAQAGQSLTMTLLAPVVPGIATFLQSTGADAASSQLVVVAPFLGLMVGSLASGSAIRLVGLRRLVLLAGGLYAAGGAIGTLAPGLLLLLIGCMLVGLGAALLTSSLSALTSVLYAEADRARMVGFQSAAANLFGVILGLGSAFLSERLGWRIPLGVFLAFGAMMLVLAAAFVPRMDTADDAPAMPIGRVLAAVWPVCLAGAAIFGIATSQSTHLPFLLDRNGITSAGMRAVVTMITSAFALMASLGYGYAQAHVRTSTLTPIAGVIGGAGWILFGVWSSGLVVPLIAAAMLGIGIGLVLPILYTSAMRAAPGEASGLSVGLLNAAIFLGSFANPLLTAPLRSWGLPGTMLAMALATGLTTLVAFLWQQRRRASLVPIL